MAEKMKERIGDRIEGSRYVRDRCKHCRQPIRVVCTGTYNQCEECDPLDRNCRVKDYAAAADRQYHGGQFTTGEW